MKRRGFLKLLAGLAAAPLIPGCMRPAGAEPLVGEKNSFEAELTPPELVQHTEFEKAWQDMAANGSGVIKDGKRMPPQEVYGRGYIEEFTSFDQEVRKAFRESSKLLEAQKALNDAPVPTDGRYIW